ncbi:MULTISPECIES: GntR family transcriptional regulator [Fictibacillus]|uniref:GntR family transcriptional regulator n=2 Tax=Fictibacillus TaxID=1329200 RepID=A0ABS2ZL73_9BACL|nr:GntR family transcriptional regulator [Fictibacillus norfolkensis]MBD7965178.1 GntR family transcriptional regulator [Fictibacillus norfolkensis]MBN3553123.1 GntR family transcriptional regulator [Fictibacillus nanhaiensis]
MLLNADSMKPIYVQISEWLENEILNESISADEKIYSQYQLAEMFNVNPATAGKGINLLADDNVLYKKRGLGMFVAADARKIILGKRKSSKLHSLVTELAQEAVQLQVEEEELVTMIRDMHQRIKEEQS